MDGPRCVELFCRLTFPSADILLFKIELTVDSVLITNSSISFASNRVKLNFKCLRYKRPIVVIIHFSVKCFSVG